MGHNEPFLAIICLFVLSCLLGAHPFLCKTIGTWQVALKSPWKDNKTMENHIFIKNS